MLARDYQLHNMPAKGTLNPTSNQDQVFFISIEMTVHRLKARKARKITSPRNLTFFFDNLVLRRSQKVKTRVT